jgi:regulator of protease activity HflC (stomatin/prohibitin superfamily)
MRTIKLGARSLLLGTVVYLIAANWVFMVCFELISEPSTLENIIGVLGIALFLAASLSLIAPLLKLWRQARKDISKMVDPPVVILAILCGLSISACTRIEPGYVGVKVNLTGDDKGVQGLPLVNGRVFFNPLTTTILEYPTFVQTAQWTRDVAETSGVNEEITFNSRENLVISADISLSYYVERAKVPEFYVKYRSDNLRNFTHGIMRNVARDAFNEVGGRYPVEDLLGPEKEKFLTEVKKKVNDHMNQVGVKIDQFGFIGAPRPPANVIAAINAKMAATQAAMQAENELRTAEAEAKKAVAKAEGQARSQLAIAEGEAKSKVLLAEGESKANELLSKSITPSLLDWRHLAVQAQAVSKWNGQRPTVEGAGSGLLLQIDAHATK